MKFEQNMAKIDIYPGVHLYRHKHVPPDCKPINKKLVHRKTTPNFPATEKKERTKAHSEQKIDFPQTTRNETTEIKNMVTETNRLVLRLTEEIVTMQKEFREMKKEVGISEREPLWISRLPCKTKDDFFEFENDLIENEFREQLVYVPLDHGEDKKPKWTVHPKGVDKLYNDPKPPDEKPKEANPRELGSSAAVVKTCNCSTKIEQMLNDLHRSNNEMFQHLTEEIVNLRREVLSMRSPNDQNLQTILPPTPFDNMDDFLKFENELQEDPDKFTELENTLSQQRKYNEPVKFVKEGIKIFFDDKLAEQFTWRGTSEKRNVRNLNCTMALRHAFRRRYPNSNEDIFDRTAMKHFQYAKDRTVKKMRYNKCDAEKFLKYQIAPKSLTDDSSPIENFKEMSN